VPELILIPLPVERQRKQERPPPIAAYMAIAAFSIRRARNRGVGTPVRPYVIAGIVVAFVLATVTVWGRTN
jgi:hypothetical protein